MYNCHIGGASHATVLGNLKKDLSRMRPRTKKVGSDRKLIL